jgi:glycine cleavage system regulatory protein
LLVAMFKAPLTRPAEVESVLNILASAAIADFERAAAHDQLQKANADLEERVRDRTNELQQLVNLMAGREVRMAELKSELRELKKGSTDAT